MPWSVAQLAWTAIACALALAGLACVVRGLWRPNLGNIKPCPKCGYDLAAAAVANKSLLCPECGSTSPADKVVSRRPRRWLLASGGLLLLLLIEPAWRMPSVPQPDGSRNWFALAPNWLLACVWPVPHPIWDPGEIDPYALGRKFQPQTGRSLSIGGRLELELRSAGLTLDASRRDLWLSIYAARMSWLWNGVPLPKETFVDTARLKVVRLERVFSRSGQRVPWEVALRDRLVVDDYSKTPDESVVLMTAEQAELDAVRMIAQASQVSRRWASFGHMLEDARMCSIEPLGASLVLLTADHDVARLEQAWHAMNAFYADASQDHPEVLLRSDTDMELRAYWIGDICSATAAKHIDLPPAEFMSTFLGWLFDQGIAYGLAYDWSTDPAGHILLLRADTRMHEQVRAFIASRRASP